MSKIFISYRRADSSGETGRLFDALRSQFGEANVFRDVNTLEAGVDFVHALEDALSECEVVLVVIGKQWLSSPGPSGRRLDMPDDLVRTEVRTALKRDSRVIPVLVAGAKMPEMDELPDDLKPLARLNAIELSDTRWEYDVARLIEAIGKMPTSDHLAVRPSGKGISGTATGVSYREEVDPSSLASITVVQFRLMLSGGEAPIGVTLRGRSLTGSIEEGDSVELPRSFRKGRPIKSLLNLTTGESVASHTGAGQIIGKLFTWLLYLVIAAWFIGLAIQMAS